MMRFVETKKIDILQFNKGMGQKVKQYVRYDLLSTNIF